MKKENEEKMTKVMTWTCHICGKKREDESISVLTYLLKDLPGAERNIRYCNDNDECLVGAQERAKTGKI